RGFSFPQEYWHHICPLLNVTLPIDFDLGTVLCASLVPGVRNPTRKPIQTPYPYRLRERFPQWWLALLEPSGGRSSVACSCPVSQPRASPQPPRHFAKSTP